MERYLKDSMKVLQELGKEHLHSAAKNEVVCMEREISLLFQSTEQEAEDQIYSLKELETKSL